jgi:putative endonuclease
MQRCSASAMLMHAADLFRYILASDSRELYVGITNDLYRRIAEHRSGFDPGSYTTKHQTVRLVYCESTDDVTAAIRREKQIKGWKEKKKAGVGRANQSRLAGSR